MSAEVQRAPQQARWKLQGLLAINHRHLTHASGTMLALLHMFCVCCQPLPRMGYANRLGSLPLLLACAYTHVMGGGAMEYSSAL
jgi:hypothetical protein